MSNNLPNKMKSSIKENEIPFKLPDNWKWFKWGDLITDYQQGLIRSNRELGKGKVAYLKMNNLDNQGGYSLDKIEYTDLTDEELLKYRLNYNDFLINVRNSRELVGKTCCIGNLPSDFVYNHMLVRIKHNESIPNQYINALLNVPIMKKFIDRCKKGTTTVIALYKDDLFNIPIPVPDKYTLEYISVLVEVFKLKIECNNRIIAELEETAKTIYEYWFMQFNFPDNSGKPYKFSGGRMVWSSNLNMDIPYNWEVCKMSNWIESDKTGDWGIGELQGNYVKKVSCIRGTDINGLNGIGECSPPTRYILNKNSFKILEPHDLIIEISGGSPIQSTGRIALITDATLNRFENPLICSNFCKAISLKNKKLLYNFSFYWNTLYDNGIFFGYEGKTSGIKNLLFDSFVNSYWTVVPDDRTINIFYNLMQSIQEKKQIMLAENQKLFELRDWLLPLLINGQVTVCKPRVDEKDAFNEKELYEVKQAARTFGNKKIIDDTDDLIREYLEHKRNANKT